MTQQQLTRQKLVDTREPEIIRQKLLTTGWEQKALWSGDYFFLSHSYQKVGITRKTVDDLMNSIGEIFSKQLEEMADYFDLKIILLEGQWTKVKDSIETSRGIRYQTWDMVWNYLRRWQDKGFTLELTSNEGHTIDRLNALYALYQKDYSLSANSKQFSDDRVLAMPSGCRGKTGLKAIETLGSLRDVANATIEQLLTVEGIGNKKAENIYQHFNRRNNNADSRGHEERTQEYPLL